MVQQPSGMVVAQVQDLGHRLAFAAERLNTISRTISGLLQHVYWRGEKADRFRGDVYHVLPALTHGAAALRALADRAAANAQAQITTSQDDGHGETAHHSRLLGLAEWAAVIGVPAAKAGVKFMTKVRYGVFQPRDAFGRFLSPSKMGFWGRFKAELLHPESSWHALPGKAAVRGTWVVAQKWVERGGFAVEAGVAAWKQWHEDADDPSLDTVARVGRAGTEAVTTAGGAWVGMTVGAAIGSAICPGVGTVVGGFVGGVVGGQVGEWVGQQLVDPVGKASSVVADWVGDAGGAIGHEISKLKFW
jgi:hypothetical protein